MAAVVLATAVLVLLTRCLASRVRAWRGASAGFCCVGTGAVGVIVGDGGDGDAAEKKAVHPRHGGATLENCFRQGCLCLGWVMFS